MKINYSIAFKKDGVWSDDYNFKRGVYAEQPLDETLDTGIVVDVPSSLNKIAPFTLCRVTAKEVLQDGTEGETLYTKYYWTGDRETEAVTLFGVGNDLSGLSEQKYRQTIKLIELTKILEREPCDSLSFTHRLQKDLLPYSEYVDYTASAIKTANVGGETSVEDPYSNDYWWSSGEAKFLYISPTTPQQTYTPKYLFCQVNGYSSKSHDFKVTFPDGTSRTVTSYNALVNGSAVTGDQYTGYPMCDNTGSHNLVEIDMSAVGTYTFEYHAQGFGIPDKRDLYIRFSITTEVSEIPVKPIPSITDVINRILEVGQTRPMYETKKYTLDSAIASKFAGTLAPEFFFPRMTMFEALLEVGKKIHAIPRLTTTAGDAPGKITFDLLGLDEEYAFPEGANIIGYKSIQAADDYCGGVDSYAENHINTVDPNAGTVTEPFDGGYKTLRCESGVQITNQSAVFECSRPIYRIVKVEMAYTDAGQAEPIGDITKYVYEQAEYAGLFVSDQAGYPNSVSHALVWKQGDRFIRGFNTTSSALLNIIQQFKKPSIQNIVQTDEGKTFPTGTVYGNLAFRVTYIPMDNIRLRQYKPYDTHPDGNLLYNQQNANTVEASAYGESLKGKIARMGNEIEVYTVRFTNKDQALPLIGNLLVDENDNVKGYVYKITTRDERTYRVADIYVTPDFNRLSEYFSLESNFRLFEVSERQSIDRQIVVSRIIDVTLGDRSARTYPHYMATTKMVRRFMDTFIQADQTVARPTVAVCKTVGPWNEDEGSCPQIGKYCYSLPVNSTACGNSLVFAFAFDDSYSAGHRSESGDGTTVDNGTGSGSGVLWKQQKNSQYGDIYGSFYALEFSIADSLYDVLGRKKSITWTDQSTAGGFCDSLPTVGTTYFDGTMAQAYLTTLHAGDEGSAVYVIDKNSSEHISLTVQLHGRALDKRIVFGSAMWNNNLLIRDDPVEAIDAYGNPTGVKRATPHIYGLVGKRLNMLRNTIDIGGNGVIDFGALVSSDLDVNYSIGTIKKMWLQSSAAIKSWCIADPTNGEIYIGVNEPIPLGGGWTSPIYFNFDREA